jgi:sialate O-acetylesterase
MKRIALLLATLLPASLFANVQLPSLISDNMVLQKTGARVWGKADPGEKVAVRIADKKFTAEAGTDGKWSVRISGQILKPGQNYEMSVAGKNELTVRNVAVGEVWVCSGQSNMEWSVANSLNSDDEIAAAKYPSIRLFTVARNATAEEPQEDCVGKWVVCSPETVGPFSAVGYYFARELNGKLKTPVGMIHSSWGGTPAQSWTPKEAMESAPELHPIIEAWQKAQADYPAAKEAYDNAAADWKKACEEARAAGKPLPPAPRAPEGANDSPARPCSLYNGMIAPLLPYTIKGAIWYQGESNASAAKLYRTLFPTLIASWRNAWGSPNLPFYYVQLANFMAKRPQPDNSNWALLREAQAMALKLKHTGMAVAIDIGEEKSIHPKNKQEVGRRLAALALCQTYAMEKVSCSGPVFSKMELEGDKARLTFIHADTGLVAKSGAPLKGFAIAGEDKVFHWADAQVKGQTVVVSSAEVPKPVAVRYAWADNPDADLQNKAGLPAAPFRTDDWE